MRARTARARWGKGKAVKKKLGEESVAACVIPIARRVQRTHPDSEPIGLLLAAAATLFAAGFTDPKDMHVVRAAERLRERLALAEHPPRRETEMRPLAPPAIAAIEALAPRWKRARGWMREEMRRKGMAAIYEMWIAPVMLCGRRGDTIVLGGELAVTAWPRRRYSGFILAALQATDTPAEGISWVDWLPANVPAGLAAPAAIGDDGGSENTTK